MGERFEVLDEHLARDTASGLIWARDALSAGFSLSWAEALDFVRGLGAEGRWGRGGWRLPSRRELLSLVDQGRALPALPEGHPFRNVWHVWYWTSTSFAREPAYAWRVQLSGGRLFYGAKAEDAMVWPVCGASSNLPATGQKTCFDVLGRPVPCAGSGQDGELRGGVPWPSPRFEVLEHGVRDRVSGLVWARTADLDGPVDLQGARAAVARRAEDSGRAWRLPSILELESLVDASRADPALPDAHPFTHVRDAYWSATASGMDRDWMFCLYLDKGAVGVGFRHSPVFSVWPVLG